MPLSLGFMLVPLVAQALMMSGACLWAQFRYRIPDYRTSAAVCYYASPLMWPFVLAALAVAVMSLGSIRILISRQSLRTFDFGGLEIGVEDIALGAGIVVLLAAVGFWWLRLLRALRSVRFANV